MVIDQTGAVVAHAAVTATNLETGEVRTAETDSTGRFQLSALPVGVYEVQSSKAGFEREIRKEIHLVVGQDATINFRLNVGEVSQQVTVNGEPPAVAVTTADISGLVGERQVKVLPLNGRSYDELMTLDPGVVNFTWEKTGGVGVSNSTVGNMFSVSGNRPQQNLFLLNGIEFTGAAENNMQPGGTSGLLLGVDAVREFNVLRDSYGAEYGKRPGAQVVMVTQSGTNARHGSTYEFFRNNALDAANYFDHGGTPPLFQRNQFGASLGGPIKTNKTFVFSNYEGFRQHLHETNVTLVPDTNARNGMLPCALVTPAPNPCPGNGLYDVGVAPGVAPLFNLWPAQSSTAPDFGGIAETFSNPLQTIRQDFGTTRLDHIFSETDSLSGVYTIDDSADTTPTSNPFSTDIESLREQVLSFEETHVFNSNLINTARFGFSRASYFYTGEPTPGTLAASVPTFLTGDPVGAVVVGGSAASNPAAQLSLAGSNNGSNLDVNRNIFTYEDQVSFTKGRHQFSFGASFQRLQSNENLALSQYGQATFTGLQGFLQGNANFLFDPTSTPLGWRTLLGAFYAEDIIRVNSELTLSLGLRDEFTTGWNEASGRASTFVFTNGVMQTQPRIGDSAFTTNNATHLFQPRIGMAWSPFSSKTVIRAGFGMYNDLQDALGYRMDQNAPFNPTYSVALPVSQFPLTPSAPVPAGTKILPGGVQPDLNTPTLVSYSLRIEQALGANTSVSAGYVGSHGYHEIVSLDANEPIPKICPAAACPATLPTGQPVPAGTFYIPAGTPKANPALGNSWGWHSEGSSSYNALQLDMNHRFSEGLAFRVAYTWSKALDDGDSLNATAAGNAPGLVMNPYDIRADWGPATYDARNVGVGNVTYALPFGQSQRWLGNWNGWRGTMVSGWSVNSIITLQGGFPFTPQLSYNPSNNGDTRNPVRPFVNPAFTGNAIEGGVTQYFNPAAFIAPPLNSGFYGNLGRDALTGPGLATWDFSAMKDTQVAERIRLEFRAEIFNLLNRANFNTPNPIVFTPSGVSPTAGVITSTSTTARQVQFGLKLLW
ncbi:MAG TPA: carboxypeptidase-like regulatory domain-containing protein [Candidatus Acidoferrales bacterium]|nr:carboxypeptidase-like regulatory domain-containing protein [Candidatus Acidoferrales bacterium]